MATERSALVIEARSTVGPISFGTTSIEGHVDVAIDESSGDCGPAPVAMLSVDLTTLRSGNKLYDAELLHRVDARRHPTTSIELRGASRIGPTDRYDVAGELTFHGITRPIAGTVRLAVPAPGTLLVTGEHVFDMRDFDIVAPSVLMLRIYPDVRAQLQLEAERVDEAEES